MADSSRRLKPGVPANLSPSSPSPSFDGLTSSTSSFASPSKRAFDEAFALTSTSTVASCSSKQIVSSHNATSSLSGPHHFTFSEAAISLPPLSSLPLSQNHHPLQSQSRNAFQLPPIISLPSPLRNFQPPYRAVEHSQSTLQTSHQRIAPLPQSFKPPESSSLQQVLPTIPHSTTHKDQQQFWQPREHNIPEQLHQQQQTQYTHLQYQQPCYQIPRDQELLHQQTRHLEMPQQQLQYQSSKHPQPKHSAQYQKPEVQLPYQQNQYHLLHQQQNQQLSQSRPILQPKPEEPVYRPQQLYEQQRPQNQEEENQIRSLMDQPPNVRSRHEQPQMQNQQNYQDRQYQQYQQYQQHQQPYQHNQHQHAHIHLRMQQHLDDQCLQHVPQKLRQPQHQNEHRLNQQPSPPVDKEPELQPRKGLQKKQQKEQQLDQQESDNQELQETVQEQEVRLHKPNQMSGQQRSQSEQKPQTTPQIEPQEQPEQPTSCLQQQQEVMPDLQKEQRPELQQFPRPEHQQKPSQSDLQSPSLPELRQLPRPQLQFGSQPEQYHPSYPDQFQRPPFNTYPSNDRFAASSMLPASRPPNDSTYIGPLLSATGYDHQSYSNASTVFMQKAANMPRRPPMRSSIACTRCRHSKIKCDNDGKAMAPCENCVRTRRHCTYPGPNSEPVKRTAESSQLTKASEAGSLASPSLCDNAGPVRKRLKMSSKCYYFDSDIHNAAYAEEIVSAPYLTSALWSQIFDIYRLHFFTELPFLHLPSLKDIMSGRVKKAEAGDAFRINIVLLGVLTLTSRFQPDLVKYVSSTISLQNIENGTAPGKRVSKPDGWEASEYYADALARVLGPLRSCMRLATIERVQAFLMLGLYEWSQSKMKEGGLSAWMYIGFAIRMAHALGLCFGDRPCRGFPRAAVAEEAAVVEAEEEAKEEQSVCHSNAFPELAAISASSTGAAPVSTATQRGSAPSIPATTDQERTNSIGNCPASKAKLLTPMAKEIRRRTMFSCLIFDRMLACGKERLPTVRSEDLQIQLPCSDVSFDLAEDVKTLFLKPRADCEYNTSKANLKVETPESLLARFIRMIDIWGEVSNYTFAGGRLAETKPPWEDTKFRRLCKILEEFYTGLPEALRLSPSNYHKHDNHHASSTYVSLHMLGSVCRIMLHREYVPFIPIRCERPIGPLDEPTFPEAITPAKFWEYSAKQLFQAAREIVDLIEICETRDKLPMSSLVVFSVWTAAFVGIYAWHFPQMDVEKHMVLERDAQAGSRAASMVHITSYGPTGTAYKALTRMSVWLQIATVYAKYFLEMDKYYRGVKRDYAMHKSKKGANTGQRSVRLGGDGGGLDEWVRHGSKVINNGTIISDEESPTEEAESDPSQASSQADIGADDGLSLSAGRSGFGDSGSGSSSGQTGRYTTGGRLSAGLAASEALKSTASRAVAMAAGISNSSGMSDVNEEANALFAMVGSGQEATAAPVMDAQKEIDMSGQAPIPALTGQMMGHYAITPEQHLQLFMQQQHQQHQQHQQQLLQQHQIQEQHQLQQLQQQQHEQAASFLSLMPGMPVDNQGQMLNMQSYYQGVDGVQEYVDQHQGMRWDDASQAASIDHFSHGDSMGPAVWTDQERLSSMGLFSMPFYF